MVVRGCFVIRDSVDAQNEDIFNLHSDTLIFNVLIIILFLKTSEVSLPKVRFAQLLTNTVFHSCFSRTGFSISDVNFTSIWLQLSQRLYHLSSVIQLIYLIQQAACLEENWGMSNNEAHDKTFTIQYPCWLVFECLIKLLQYPLITFTEGSQVIGPHCFTDDTKPGQALMMHCCIKSISKRTLQCHYILMLDGEKFNCQQ